MLRIYASPYIVVETTSSKFLRVVTLDDELAHMRVYVDATFFSLNYVVRFTNLPIVLDN